MNVQETIKHLQSSIKKRGNELAFIEKAKIDWKTSAQFRTKAGDEYSVYDWRQYHHFKNEAITLAKQQKIEKSLYKLMLKISKSSPNGSISLYQIREM